MMNILSAKPHRPGTTARLLTFACVLSLATGAFALDMTTMDTGIQTKSKEAVERRLSLRLPLEQVRFHWIFRSREDFLAGRLVLRIVRGDKAAEIVVFEHGKLSDGWESMSAKDDLGVYFGFQSTRKYPTAPGDQLEIELTVVKDLDGIGPTETGILPAGTYKSKGSYSGLVDEFDTAFLTGQLLKEHGSLTDQDMEAMKKLHERMDYTAFLENWDTQWALKITGDKGWLPADKAAQGKSFMEKQGKPASSQPQ